MPLHRSLALLAALLALTPALAGCVQDAALTEAAGPADVASVVDRLTPVLGDLPVVHRVLDVETPHGLVNVDLYLPEVSDGRKLPLLLVASPYNNANSPLALSGGGKRGDENWISLPLYEWIRRELVPRGYAFAQMDILGTRNSGGCQGIMDAKERESTAAVIDHLGAQPWSNGKVGMIGKSYLGMSQMGAALENPERLVTIVPISGPTHDYAYHFHDGVPYRLNVLTNVLYYGAFSLPPPDGEPQTYAARYPERVPCAPEAIASGALVTGDYSARWQERDYRPRIPQMRDDIAVLFIHGHQDWNVKPDHVLDVYNAFPGPKMALIGQWAHDYPNINNHDDDTYGERTDWYYMLHRWFDHWLLGVDTGLLDEMAACPVQTQGADAVWRCLNAFPPRPARFDEAADSGDGVAWTPLHPGAAGVLAATPGAGSVAYTDAVNGALGQAYPHAHAFAAEPADAATRLVGAPELAMRVRTTSPVNTYLAAALAVERDGKRSEFTWAFLSLRHRDGLEQGQAVAPGTDYDVRLRFYPVDHVLEPGDRLVLVVRGTSDTPNGGIMVNPTPGVQTVDLAATTLWLPQAGLDRAFTPLTDADLPETYHQEI